MKPVINATINKIIADPLADDEIMATGPGRNKKFEMHFNSFVDEKHKNNQEMIKQAYRTYKNHKGF